MKEHMISKTQVSSNYAALPVIGMIHALPIADIHPMSNSPFQIRDDPAMCELIASVAQYGILTPVEVRPIRDGRYETISGARRKHAAILAGLDTLPAIVLDLDDDDAIIRMVDSNIQRESILPSERAYAYKMRLEAIKRKAGRPGKGQKENSPKFSANFRSDDSLGEKLGISGDTVRNYIALTMLIPALMQMVDEKRIGLTPAYHLTALSQEEQTLLVDTIECEQTTPSLSQAQRLKKLSQAGELNEDTILIIMSEQKKPVKSDVTLSGDKLRKYFPRMYSPAKIEELIFVLLDAWVKQRKSNQSH